MITIQKRHSTRLQICQVDLNKWCTNIELTCRQISSRKQANNINCCLVRNIGSGVIGQKVKIKKEVLENGMFQSNILVKCLVYDQIK